MNLLTALQRDSREISQVYPSSCVRAEGGTLALVRAGNAAFVAFEGDVGKRFSGSLDRGSFSLCPANHENRMVLNELLPYTAPTALGRACTSFGFGDRLGFANAAQVSVIKGTAVRPVLAQQSLRELMLTGRRLPEVIDCAAWAVFREGYRLGYGCDGDHLKTVEEIASAVEDGASMITIDCSLVLRRLEKSDRAWLANFEAMDPPRRESDLKNYLQNEHAAALSLRYSKELLARLHFTYDAAIRLIEEAYRSVIAPAGREIDLEISLDETVETTSPEAHYFVAAELQAIGIRVTGIAPKFEGEFQKAIEYIGDPDALKQSMALHAKIADDFGHKLSLHSASEKFSVLPIIASLTNGRCHIKTSGTSWLEVVETIAKQDPALYRRMHAAALAGIGDARQFYAVRCDLSRVAPLSAVSDQDLPTYLRQDDSRQLMHITYGHILGNPALKADILQFLQTHRADYEAEIRELYRRHLSALRIPL